jgi:hypothetical protein
MADSADLGKLISDAVRVADSRRLKEVVYLLKLAAVEAAKAGEIPPSRPVEKPKPYGPFGHRRGS